MQNQCFGMPNVFRLYTMFWQSNSILDEKVRCTMAQCQDRNRSKFWFSSKMHLLMADKAASVFFMISLYLSTFSLWSASSGKTNGQRFMKMMLFIKEVASPGNTPYLNTRTYLNSLLTSSGHGVEPFVRLGSKIIATIPLTSRIS